MTRGTRREARTQTYAGMTHIGVTEDAASPRVRRPGPLPDRPLEILDGAGLDPAQDRLLAVVELPARARVGAAERAARVRETR